MNDSACRGERWLPVIGYEGLYEVSDLGRVRSLDRDVVVMMPGGRGTANGRTVRHYRGKVLRHTASSNGYPEVGLCRNGKNENRLVHLLVLEAFVGPCPPGQEARHGPPGDKTDARLVNLCYGTRKENFADRIRDEQDNRGERHGLAVTTREIVLDIRKRVAAGERQSDVADAYELTRANVWAIVHRKSWDWLPY